MRTAHLIAHSAPLIGLDEEEAVLRVLRSGRLAQGPEVEAFEDECAALVGRRFGIAVSSGTAALHLALNVLGLGDDAQVAIPAYACASLLTAIRLQGAGAWLADVDSNFSLNLSPVPPDVSCAIVPHLFGRAAALPATEIVIEDLAQSLGGATGRRGAMAIASFYATKMMTTGEGGMLFTDDVDVADAARDRRDYDNRDEFLPRFCYKMTDMQAALGRVQLGRLPGFIDRRRAIAYRYLEALHPLPIDLPDPEDHVFFRFVVATPRQQDMLEHLNACGVEAKRPVHCPAHHYRDDARKAGIRIDGAGAWPWADRAHAEAVSLPIHPGMSDGEVEHVIDTVTRFFD